MGIGFEGGHRLFKKKKKKARQQKGDTPELSDQSEIKTLRIYLATLVAKGDSVKRGMGRARDLP